MQVSLKNIKVYTMKQNNIFEEIADFIQSSSFEDLPLQLVSDIKVALIDYIGVTIVGSNSDKLEPLYKYEKALNNLEESTIFGTGKKSSVIFTSQINAMASHVHDFDDVSWSTIGHPTIVVAPTCFSFAEKYKRSGRDVILAYALAIEVMHKLADTTMPNISENGWHTTCVYGVFGSLIAAVILKGDLTKNQIVNALGIAVSKASGVRANFGTDTKSFHAGIAVKNGIEAMYLAYYGLTSSKDAFDGPDGFMQVFAQKKYESKSLNLSQPWDILDRGFVFKKFPSCSSTHPACDLIFDMKSEYNINHEEIEKIEVFSTVLTLKDLTYNLPKTALEAKFSIQYPIASILVYDQLRLEEFEDEKINNPVIQDLMSKISLDTNQEFLDMGFIGTAPIRIKVYFKNKKILNNINMLARGNKEKPLSSKEIKDKFLYCSRSLKNNEFIYDEINKLEKLKSLDTLVENLVI